MGSRLVAETAWERYGGDESADGTVTILPRRICGRCCYHAICSCWGAAAGERDYRDESADAAVGVEVLGSETEETNLRTALLPCYLKLLGCRCWGEVLGGDTEETNLRTVLLPCYLQLLGCSCWGAIRRRRICGRCCYHAICSCWGAAAGERDGGDESADAAVTMLFAAVGVELLGSETEETNLRTVLLPCYLQLLGWSCWGAIRRRRICGRCCCHAICSCWGGGAGERVCGDESADGAVAMLFAAVGPAVEVLGSDTEETNLRTVLLPCYLQLLGWRCWGAIRTRRICGRCCYHAICSCWGAAAGERDGGDESADAAVAMLFAAVGVQLLGSETEETNLRTVLLPCYLQLLGCSCCGAIRRRRICGRCCCHAICSCWGAAAKKRDGGDESADVLLPCYLQLLGCSCWGARRRETNLRTLLLPRYLQLLGCSCWGAIRRRRICGRCCYHAICSCRGAAAGERYGGDESADAAVVTMLFAAVGVQLLGSETAEMKLRTVLLPCESGIEVGGDSEETELRTVVVEDVAV